MKVKFLQDYSKRKKGDIVDIERKSLFDYVVKIGVAEKHTEQKKVTPKVKTKEEKQTTKRTK